MSMELNPDARWWEVSWKKGRQTGTVLKTTTFRLWATNYTSLRGFHLLSACSVLWTTSRLFPFSQLGASILLGWQSLLPCFPSMCKALFVLKRRVSLPRLSQGLVSLPLWEGPPYRSRYGRFLPLLWGSATLGFCGHFGRE